MPLMRSISSNISLIPPTLKTPIPNKIQPNRLKTSLSFPNSTQFRGLEVLDFQDGDNVAFVTFVAHISHNDHETTFTEKSHFEKVDGRWLYRSGEVAKGRVPTV